MSGEYLVPLADRIVVQPIPNEERTKAGIYLPDEARKPSLRGVVLAVGPGKRSETTGELFPLDIHVGDTVVYAPHGAVEVEINGETVLMLSTFNTLAVEG